MLPFLGNKRIQTIIVATKDKGMPMEISDGEDHPLSAAADDLIQAVHSKDTQAVAKALEAAFQIMESMPDEENEAEEEKE